MTSEPRQVNIRIDPELWQQIRVAAVVQRVQIKEFVEQALRKALEESTPV